MLKLADSKLPIYSTLNAFQERQYVTFIHNFIYLHIFTKFEDPVKEIINSMPA